MPFDEENDHGGGGGDETPTVLILYGSAAQRKSGGLIAKNLRITLFNLARIDNFPVSREDMQTVVHDTIQSVMFPAIEACLAETDKERKDVLRVGALSICRTLARNDAECYVYDLRGSVLPHKIAAEPDRAKELAKQFLAIATPDAVWTFDYHAGPESLREIPVLELSPLKVAGA